MTSNTLQSSVRTSSFLKFVMLSLLILLVSPQTFANKLKLEPAFWWSGMHNTQLQLLVYGNNISQHQVSLLKAENVKLVSVESSASANHLFINLDLSHAPAQTIQLALSHNGQTVNQIDYSIKARKQGSANRQGFSNKDVIYLITPDRFVNGDSNNDNHPEMLESVNRSDKDGRHGGDIAGIRQALPYLKNLGVTQLWINPLLENNQPKYSYHGYSTTDFYKIDPRFGSNQDYIALVEDAREHGIGIIKDVIVNHMGNGHRWMEDFPTATWINGQQQWQHDNQDIQFTSHRRTTMQDPYAVASDASEFEHGWFVESMPDLNQRDPHMATYLIQNSIWWVEYAGLSGIREDTYSYADKHFLAKWSKAIMDEYPNFNIVGEEWSANPITVSYWQAGKQNQDGYQSFTPSMMDFPLYETLIASLNAKEDWGSGLINLYEALANDVIYADPTQLVLFEGNHDTNRLYSLVNEDMTLFEIAMAYVLTSNRIPQIFYGSEIAMTSPTEGRHDGAVRADFPGGWQGDAVNVFTQQGLNPVQTKALSFMTKLLNFRKQSSAIHQGKLQHYVPQDGVYVQLRHTKDEALLIIYNKQGQVNLDVNRFSPQLSQLTLNQKQLGQSSTATNVLSGEVMPLQQALQLKHKGVTILSLN